MANEVCAVVVAYNPSVSDLTKNVSRIVSQVDNVFIINNSSYDISLSEEFDNVEIINLRENVGVAGAQNFGFKRALSEGYEFTLQCDQDTTFPPGYVRSLLDIYTHLERSGFKVGVIGSNVFDEHTQSVLSPIFAGSKPGEIFSYVDAVISSGSLINNEAAAIVGYMNQELFIDLVDFDFCWRLARAGFCIIRAEEHFIHHFLGEGRIKIFGKSLIGIPKPFRHYFQMRNTVYICLRGVAPIKWKIKNCLKLIIKILVYPILLPQGFVRLKFMLSGVFDGLRGRLGPFPQGNRES